MRSNSTQESDRQVETKAVRRSPWTFLPFTDGLNGIYNTFGSTYINLVFKTLGASNAMVGLASLLALPVGFNALWAPLVERWGTFRSTLLRNILVIGILIAVASACFLLPNPPFLLLAVMFFVVMVFVSFYDICNIGFRVSALTGSQIALFSGLSSAFFRLGLLFSGSFLLILSGRIAVRFDSDAYGWAATFLILGLLILGAYVYLRIMLPYPASDRADLPRLTLKGYADSYLNFIRQRRGWLMLAFLFMCRVGQGVVNVIKNPFILDPIEEGGLAMTVADIGLMGPFILITLILSGILGGVIVRYVGLQRCFWLLGLLMFLPNAAFSWLALNPRYTLIGIFGMQLNPWLLGVTLFEIFGYGVSFAAIVTFSALLAKNAGINKATFGALTGSMNLLGFMLGGALSGFIQEGVGYFWTFNISILLSIPAWVMIFFLPVREVMEKSAELDAQEAALLVTKSAN